MVYNEALKGSLVEQNFNLMHVTTLLRFLFYFRVFFPK